MPIRSLRAHRPRRGRQAAQDTAAGLAGACAVALAALACQLEPVAPPTTPLDLTASAVAQRTATLEAELERSAQPPPPRAVRVRLAFGAGADLDLYATDRDPHSNETVYFAKHSTRAGGRLLRDARCGDPAPRTDSAIFDAVPAHGLRIGIDHHAGCAGPAASEPFVVEIAYGEHRELRRGVARPGQFDDRFWMWSPRPD